MKLESSGSPELMPDPNQSSVLRLGLQRVPVQQWFVDDDLRVFARHKQLLLASDTESVYAALPESIAAQREFSDILLNQLLGNQTGNYRTCGKILRHNSGLKWPLPADNLKAASQWIAEDICILEPRQAGYTLTAASVCSPSNWRLKDKIGKSVTDKHKIVPGYAQYLDQRVNRLFNGLKPERLFVRHNWSLQPGNELNWQSDLVTEDDCAAPYWRVELQTLVRLPRTRAVVFCIRLYLYNLQRLRAEAGFYSALAAQLARLQQSERNYKGLSDNWWQRNPD